MGILRLGVRAGLLAALLGLSFALGGCGKETIVVGNDDDGSNLELQRGGYLYIALDANPEVNLLWVVEYVDQNVLELERKGLVPCEEVNRIGGHFRREFKFKAKRTGETRLVLVLVSTAEYGDTPSDEYRLKVKVVK